MHLYKHTFPDAQRQESWAPARTPSSCFPPVCQIAIVADNPDTGRCTATTPITPEAGMANTFDYLN